MLRLLKNTRKNLLNCLLLLFFPVTGYSQTISDIRFASGLPDRQDAHKIVLVRPDRPKSVMALAGRVPYLFYKNYISSQDNQQCSFYPTCANYAMLSVEKYGYMRGVLESLDRLTRCHNTDWEHYAVHLLTGKWYDHP